MNLSNHYPALITNSTINANRLTFTGKGRTNIAEFGLAKRYGSVSCPCCGEKMREFDEEKAKKLAAEIGPLRGDDLYIALTDNMDQFQVSKRRLVKKMANLALTHTRADVSNMLAAVSGKYKKSLAEKEIGIIDRMTEMLLRKGVSKSEAEAWRDLEIKRLKTSGNDKAAYKRQRIMGSFTAFAQTKGVTFKDKEIEDLYSRMPLVARDTDAFVMFYKNKKPEKIVYAMLKNTTPTVEHIKTYSETRDNNLSNLLVMCKSCNNMRDNMPYSEFVKIHPEMIRNLERYFKDVEKILSSPGTRPDVKEKFKNYTYNARRTFEKCVNSEPGDIKELWNASGGTKGNSPNGIKAWDRNARRRIKLAPDESRLNKGHY